MKESRFGSRAHLLPVYEARFAPVILKTRSFILGRWRKRLMAYGYLVSVDGLGHRW
jgi:hypothetical protein